MKKEGRPPIENPIQVISDRIVKLDKQILDEKNPEKREKLRHNTKAHRGQLRKLNGLERANIQISEKNPKMMKFISALIKVCQLKSAKPDTMSKIIGATKSRFEPKKQIQGAQRQLTKAEQAAEMNRMSKKHLILK